MKLRLLYEPDFCGIYCLARKFDNVVVGAL